MIAGANMKSTAWLHKNKYNIVSIFLNTCHFPLNRIQWMFDYAESSNMIQVSIQATMLECLLEDSKECLSLLLLSITFEVYQHLSFTFPKTVKNKSL